jgi:hypothetical protein
MTMKIDAVEADEEEARFRHFERESAKVCTDALKYLVSELREKREEGISPEWNYPHFSLRQYAVVAPRMTQHARPTITGG